MAEEKVSCGSGWPCGASPRQAALSRPAATSRSENSFKSLTAAKGSINLPGELANPFSMLLLAGDPLPVLVITPALPARLFKRLTPGQKGSSPYRSASLHLQAAGGLPNRCPWDRGRASWGTQIDGTPKETGTCLPRRCRSERIVGSPVQRRTRSPFKPGACPLMTQTQRSKLLSVLTKARALIDWHVATFETLLRPPGEHSGRREGNGGEKREQARGKEQERDGI